MKKSEEVYNWNTEPLWTEETQVIFECMDLPLRKLVKQGWIKQTTYQQILNDIDNQEKESKKR